MRLTRFLIAWGFYCGCLAAVGTVVFLYVRHTPRCTITGKLDLEYLWPDGSRLATFRTRFAGIGFPTGGHGPLQIWDAGTGRLIHEFFNDIELRPWEISPDGQRIALFDKKGALRIVDWRTGEEWRCADVPPSRFGKFSAKGRWLYAVAMDSDDSVVLDISTRQVQLRIKEAAAIDFSPDERCIFARPEENDDNTTPVSVWDVAAARKVATIPSDAIRTFIGEVRLEVSPDGKAVGVCVPAERGPDDGIVRHKAFEIWSLPEGKKRFRYDLPVIGVQDFLFSPDGRTVAGWLSYDERPSQLTVFDVADGRRIWQAPVLRASEGKFSPDGSLFLMLQGKDSKYSLRVFDATSGQELWQQPSTGCGAFAGNSIVLNRAADDSRLQVLNARTGELKWTETMRPRNVLMLPSSTPDASHFVIQGVQSRGRNAYFWEKWLDDGWPDFLGEGRPFASIVESATGRELFRVHRGKPNDLRHTLLSDDGSTLVTVELVDFRTGTNTLRIWDVQPRRAYAWSLAAIAALMLVLFTISRSLRALRKRKAAPANC